MNGEDRSSSSGTKVVLIVVGVVGGIFVVCVLACVGVAYFGMRAVRDLGEKAMERVADEQAARVVAEPFLTDLIDGKADAAYPQTTQAFKSRLTLQELRDLMAKNATLKKRTSSWLFAQTVTPQLVVFQGTINGPQGSVNCTIHVAKDGETWKVDRFSIP